MENVDFESAAVQNYVSILQAVISRMATNSASCKTWCITIVSAIVVIIATTGKPDYIWIALLPIVLLLFLDAFYLGLERGFISRYNNFVKKVHAKKASIEDVYVVGQISGLLATMCSVVKALVSLSIWPFYGMLLLMLLLTRYVILNNPAS